MGRNGRYCILLFLFCVLSSSARAQEDESTWSLSLDSITVKGYRYRSPVKAYVDGVTLWDMGNMSLLPQILGNADPMHYAQMLPGIQTNSEYRSGINIEGCDNQHNAIFIEGVPIYNVNHLLGFFSTFNSSHFPSMSVAKGLVSSASPNRLGGQLEMHHAFEVPDSASGTLSLGLISSQGTLCLPLSSRTSLTASLRGSYINWLYSKWLEADGQQVNYAFCDVNVSLVHRLNSCHTFLADFYYGHDDAGFSEGNYLADMKARWGNVMGAAHWMYDRGDLSLKTTAYVTAYRNRFSLEMEDMFFRLPSGITDYGLKSDVVWNCWNAGVEAAWHDIRPQSLEHEGDFNVTDGNTPPMRSLEASVYGNYTCPLADNLSLLGGVRGSLFRKGHTAYWALDPSVRLLYDNHTLQFSATYALRHQYLFQTGFSDSGLPTEFWISASEDFKPQYAHEIIASGSSYLFNRRFRVSVDVFYRRLYHQLGYKGSLFDYLNTVYDIHGCLMHGKGENYGFSLMLNKCSGPLTGWLSYTYTHARRSFDGTGRRKSYPASHERPHELNAVATYSLGRHWNFGGTLVAASGTPFTAAKSLFLLNDNLIIKYGVYNAARLHPYFRLDLSVNYRWGRESQHGVNFSLYNVTSRNNELFYYLKTRDDGSFVYRPVTFVLHALPSLSYHYKF
ncbi:MAG: TonB-dependent receptor [Prevotella sp.]|nr:TonB-dependent receptor [Prevotella sp.]